ncbi:hypothetical protein PM082_004064 [Marasmius tenuissimus]|nr:hypothetical protein PM082_004064 [Marasmius tenuissimus]
MESTTDMLNEWENVKENKQLVVGKVSAWALAAIPPEVLYHVPPLTGSHQSRSSLEEV